MANHSVRVALCQIRVVDGDRDGNFERIEQALSRAASESADLAVFPESCIYGWENPVAHERATSIPGPDTDRLAELVSRFRLWVAIGLDEKAGDDLYDSAVLFDPDGRIVHSHRKVDVLPELMTPPYASGRASDLSVVGTPWGRTALVICADTLNDPFMSALEDLQPDLVLVPYGWAAPGSDWPDHAESLASLVSARASQFNAPVVGVNAVGTMTQGPWAGFVYGGASLAALADGTVATVMADRGSDVRVVSLTLA